MTLLTQRLRLRRIRRDDLDELARLYADPRVMEFSLGRMDREQSREKLEKILAGMDEHGWPTYAVEMREGDGFAGICGFAPQTVDEVDEVELGYRFMPDYWGGGIATEAAIACKEHAFTVLALPRIISIIEPANIGSIRVAEKTGLVFEKETRKWERRVRIYAAAAPGETTS